jgi:phosphopantothenoylcysteine decarboxylase / phosphopantothenate---cysteine ligase
MTVKGKKILIGITGAIAAYKACEIIRALVKLGADVKAVITPNAKEFITETTLRTLTRNEDYCEQFDVENWKPEHISLADGSDLLLIAPASANTISKIANGICDNLLTSITLAFKKKIIIAPSMNTAMWDNLIFQKNLEMLKNNGICIIEPKEGELACGYSGKGRLAEISVIVENVVNELENQQFLKGKKILVTAGGTKENIDPVRYIGNYSSAKMGIAIADKAFEAGAEVTLVSSVEVNRPYTVIKVKSALEMLEKVKEKFKSCTALIMAAAVADFRPENINTQKIKKNKEQDSFTIKLVKNPDILKEIGDIKKKNQIVVGFSAESENLKLNATAKLKDKNLDFIVANDILRMDAGFESDYNEVLIIDKQGKTKELKKALKTQIAQQILEEIFKK